MKGVAVAASVVAGLVLLGCVASFLAGVWTGDGRWTSTGWILACVSGLCTFGVVGLWAWKAEVAEKRK